MNGSDAFELELDEPVMYQYRDSVALFHTAQCGNNLSLIRYSEILLVGAEAHAKTGNESKGLEYLNMVRERAGASTSTATGNSLVEAIWSEKFRENQCDMIIWEEIQRTRKFPIITDGVISYVDAIGAHGPFHKPGVQIEEKHLLLPLPTDAIQRNPSLVQNPGW